MSTETNRHPTLGCLLLSDYVSFNMLIATQAKSVEGTQKYFEQVLIRGDCHLGQVVGGQWHVKRAGIIGIGREADVSKEGFSNLLKAYGQVFQLATIEPQF